MVQLSLSKGPPQMQSSLPWDWKDLHRRFVHALSRPARQSCYKADRLIASLLSHHLQYANFMLQGRTLQTRPQTGGDMWEPLMPDVVAPKAQQNNITAICEHSGSTFGFTTQEFWWVVTRRILKNHKTVKIGGWVLAWVGTLARDNTVVTVWCVVLCKSYFYLSNSALVECQVLG